MLQYVIVCQYNLSYFIILYIESICTSPSTVQQIYKTTSASRKFCGPNSVPFFLFAKAILISMLLGVPQQAMGRSGDA